MRVATLPGPPTIPSTGISIHATHAGGDSFRAMPLSLTTISIHATHAGGDWTFFSLIMVPRYFNPRHPCGWRRILHFLFCSAYYFNPRHPCGWRLEFAALPGHALFISIHATHAGGDSTWTAWTACGRHFNPRHPCGWRRHRCSHMLHPSYFNPRHPCGWRRTIRHHLIHAMYFNPRHPCGWRPSCQPPFVRSFGFQSTPPMRVATGRTGGTAEQAGISIHATHAGGDYELRTNRNAGGISIHATHAGGDVTIRECGKGDGLFQSTPPMRVATPAAFRIRTVPGRFQSTPPMRVATLSEFFLAIGQKFQSTPPMRVATETSAPTEPESAISIHATHAGGDD